MGLRIERALARAMAENGRPVEHVILVGLANEYVSYFTTPEEYALQFYEGASTVYGPASGPLIEDRLTLLAASSPILRPRKAITYSPGPGRRSALPTSNRRPRCEPDSRLLYDETGQPMSDAPTFCWSTACRPFPHLPSTLGG